MAIGNLFKILTIFVSFFNIFISSYPVVDKPKLRFNSQGKFKIINFADLHYGEYPGSARGRYQDGNSTRVMNTLLDLEHPDFVVFTGDIMSADVILINSTRFIDAAFESVSTKGYKWSSTYGNHDNGIATTREQIFKTESKYKNSYTKHGDNNILGLTNYVLPIYPMEGDHPPVLFLWFFDSRGGFDKTGPKPSTVHESVVEWFKNEHKKLNETWGKIPGLAFFHIPTLEYEDLQENMENQKCQGLQDDKVVPQTKDTGFISALLESNIITTFVGHDHGNSWCCKYETLEMCYNRRTGYGGYGNWKRGGRVIEFDINQDIWKNKKNYVRLEDGAISDEF